MSLFPYPPGRSLELKILESYGSKLPDTGRVTATISRVFTMTMSIVLEISINTKSDSKFRGVLKLYDRRFGTCLREVRGKHVPQTLDDEDLFQSIVRRGDITRVLQGLEEEQEKEFFPLSAWQHLDGTT